MVEEFAVESGWLLEPQHAVIIEGSTSSLYDWCQLVFHHADCNWDEGVRGGARKEGLKLTC